MSFYMLVLVDDEGMFQSEPEFFDLKSEAVAAKNDKTKTNGFDWVVMQCEEVTSRR